MGSVTTLPRGRAFAREDLERLPDDGHRYELVDGSLLVTPAPALRHQVAVLNLAIALKRACGDQLQVVLAPFDVVLSDHTVLQPDIVVARRTDLTERGMSAVPLLAVEVLSPSTRRIDLTLKRSQFEAAGCPSYWVVNPDVPGLTAWELHEGRYAEVVSTSGDQAAELAQPFPISIVPTRLLD